MRRIPSASVSGLAVVYWNPNRRFAPCPSVDWLKAQSTQPLDHRGVFVRVWAGAAVYPVILALITALPCQGEREEGPLMMMLPIVVFPKVHKLHFNQSRSSRRTVWETSLLIERCPTLEEGVGGVKPQIHVTLIVHAVFSKNATCVREFAHAWKCPSQSDEHGIQLCSRKKNDVSAAQSS